MRKSLPLYIAFALAVVTMAGVGWEWHRSRIALLEAERWENHTYEVMLQGDKLLSGLTDAETSQRSFLLTGSEEHLQPFDRALPQVAQALAALRPLTKDKPHQQQRLDSLEPLARARLASLKEGIELRRTKGLEAAIQALRTNRGISLMDELRLQAADFQAGEARLLTEHRLAKEASFARSFRLGLVGGILSGAFMLVGFLGLKRQQAAIAAAQAQLRMVTDTMAAGVTRCSRNLRYLWASHAHARWLGRSPEEIAGRPIVDVIGRAAYEAIRPHIERVLTGQKVEYETQADFLGPGLVWINAVYTPTHDAAGVVDGWVAVVTDITRRMRTEAQLRLQATTLQATANAIMITNRDGAIQWANSAFERLTGYSLAEAAGQNPRIVSSGQQDAAFFKQLWDTILAGQPWHGELVNKRKNGTLYTEEMTITPVKDSAGLITHFIAVKQDVTQRKQAEAALREQALLAKLRLDVTHALQEQSPLPVLLQRVAALLVERLDAAFARVWTLDPAGQTLELQASAGLYTHLNGPHARVALGQAKIGRIAQQRCPLITNEVIGDPHIPNQDWARREGLVAFAGFPLLSEGRLLGVVALFARHKLSPAAVETFGDIAGTLAQVLGRKQAEEAVRRNETIYRLMARSIPEGAISVVDSNLRYLTVEGQLLPRLGLSAQNMLGRTVQEVFPGEIGTIRAGYFRQALAGQTTNYETEYHGRIVWSQFVPLHDEHGNTSAAMSLGMDVTDRKHAELELAALRDQLQSELTAMNRLHSLTTRFLQQADLPTLLDATLDAAIAITGAGKGNIQLLDTTSGELGIAVQRGFDQAFVEFFSHIRPGDAACGAAMQSRQCVIVEDITLSPIFQAQPRALELKLAAGMRAVTCTPLLPRAGELVGVLSVHFPQPHRPNEHDLRLLDLLAQQAADFIARIQAEEALRAAREELARANVDLENTVQQRTANLREAVAELEGFSYSLVHDMRAPLRAMLSYAGILELDAGARLQPEDSDLLRKIKIAALRMDQLVTDSLNYSCLLRQDLPLGPVDLGALIRGMVETYPNLQPPHADISIELAGLIVHGNQAALTQVFSNLLGNAVKFVAPGVHPSVRVWSQPATRNPPPAHASRITHHAPPHQSHHPTIPPSINSSIPPSSVLVWVEDNGIGIPKDQQQKIFGMFQRMHRSNEYPGTGIGLALVRKSLDRTGGQVCLDSEPGRGSRFCVVLPLAPQDHQAHAE